MALTLSYGGLDVIKGPYQGAPASNPYRIYRGTLNFTGTYATGGNQYDLCNFFVGSSRRGVTAIKVNWVKAFGDDTVNSVTVADAQTALANGGSATAISAASTGNLATLKLYTGTPNGVGTAELTNATAVTGTVGIAFACELTYGSAGLA